MDPSDAAEAPETPARPWRRVGAFVRRHRRRLSLLALAVFLAAVAIEVGGVVPREVRVAVPLDGPGGPAVREARIDYRQDGEVVKSVRRPVRGGARELRDTVELSPGRYDVVVTLRREDGVLRELAGRLEAPAEGVVRLGRGERGR